MAYTVMAYLVMAYLVMAYLVMAYVVMAYMIGGNYGLLNRTTAMPNPDYYVAKLFHDLMGSRVLSLTSPVKAQGLRSYAHCHLSMGGNATLLLINVSPVASFNLTLPGSGEVSMYVLTAGDGTEARWRGLDSGVVRLNGVAMADPTVGRAPPRTLAAGSTVAVAALSIAFAAITGVAACDSSAAELGVFFSVSRSTPTANADDRCRSEGTQRRISPRLFRCHPPTRSVPRR